MSEQSEQIEHEAAEQIRRMMDEDERFNAVSGATAYRRADPKAGWQDAGYFSFERGGHLYFVTVESAGYDSGSRPTASGGTEDERYRDWMKEIVDAYGLGSTPEAFCRHIHDTVMEARDALAAPADTRGAGAGEERER